MKGLDNTDMFKHGANGKKQATKAYINTYITLMSYNSVTRTTEPQGKYILAVTGVRQAVLTIYRTGASPILSFNVSRNINWTLQNRVYVYITDTKGEKWLLQFQNEAEASLATAEMTILLAVKKTTECASFDTNLVRTGKPLQVGDTATLSFQCFSLAQFPYAQLPPDSSERDLTIQVTRDKLPSGFVTGITGMTVGSTRAVWVPQQFSTLENGQVDSRFPHAHFIAIVTIKAITEQAPQPQAQPAPQPQTTIQENQENLRKQRRPSEVYQEQHRQSEVNQERRQSDVFQERRQSDAFLEKPPEEERNETQEIDDPLLNEPTQPIEEDDGLDPEERERRQRIERIRKMGGVSQFGMPSFSSNPERRMSGVQERRVSNAAFERRVSNVTQESIELFEESPKSKSKEKRKPSEVNKHQESSPKSINLSSNDLERSIMEKIDLLTGGQNDVLRGVSIMTAQLQQTMNEIDRLKEEMEEYRAQASAAVSFKDLDMIKRETEQIKKENQTLEARIREKESRCKQLQKMQSENQQKAKDREKAIIKKLMAVVYEQISNALDDNGHYTGEEVSQQLYKMFRQYAFPAMDDITQKGLF